MNTSKLESVPRVILWSAPRCISTAFERSIRTLQDVHVMHECYCTASYLGKERTSQRYKDQEPIDGFSFNEVKKLLEDNYPGCSAIFMKDMAYSMAGKLHTLPEGYSHTFLIRNPSKAVSSLYRTISKGNMPEWSSFNLEEVGFCEMWELYQYVKENFGIQPVVVDADELLSNPAGMMKAYCEATNLQYKDTMLNWEPENQDQWLWEKDWYGTVKGSSGFIVNPGGSAAVSKLDVSSLPDFVQDAISAAQPYYDKLFNCRLKL
ncbi:uncharacterized protein LOC100368540 [Saccoglossus kowalevskii]|uniref:Uncharacterized protein LOC100368540 n=1 Tax=Saccoglossus kowalevskii TaxID=10224 RepID=A0ABM0GYW4_SACKO|nr:PREDICTED: uncharacterized protein LOC100368540 [Saccoglossus kowalevskii]